MELPYFIWSEIMSYFEGWRLLEYRLVSKLWNTCIKPISGYNLKYNIVEGNRNKRDKFMSSYGKHARGLEIKYMRSSLKPLVDASAVQKLIDCCYNLSSLKFQIQQEEYQDALLFDLLIGIPGIKHLSLTGNITKETILKIQPAILNLKSFEIGHVNNHMDHKDLIDELCCPNLKTLTISGCQHSSALVNGIQEKFSQLSTFYFLPTKNDSGLEFLMFDMKSRRVKKIKGSASGAIKKVGVVFNESEQDLLLNVEGKHPSVYFQSLFFFGIWRNSNSLLDLNSHIPHVNLVDLKTEESKIFDVLISSFPNAQTIIIEITNFVDRIKLPACSFNATSLSVDFGKHFPDDYFKWVSAYFPNLRELYIYYKYLQLDLRVCSTMQCLRKLYSSVPQDYKFWPKLLSVGPQITTIYLSEHDYDRVDLVEEFPNIVFGYWSAHPGKKFSYNFLSCP